MHRLSRTTLAFLTFFGATALFGASLQAQQAQPGPGAVEAPRLAAPAATPAPAVTAPTPRPSPLFERTDDHAPTLAAAREADAAANMMEGRHTITVTTTVLVLSIIILVLLID